MTREKYAEEEAEILVDGGEESGHASKKANNGALQDTCAVPHTQGCSQ